MHGRGDHGFVPILIGIARDKGVSGFVGDGANRWPGVHRLDAARLFRLGVEGAPAGSRWHGVGDEGVPFRTIAEVIGRHLDVPVRSIAPEEAASHFGFLGALVSVDNPTSNALTRERLGWEPVEPGLLADLDEGHYFAWVRPPGWLPAPAPGPVRAVPYNRWPAVGARAGVPVIRKRDDMKIAVVGTGAMGSVYAGLLGKAGHEVWAIDTWQEHIDAIAGVRPDRVGGERQLRRRQPPRRARPR